MSLHRPYPPDTHTGDDGEAGAWLRRDEEAPDLIYRNGGTCGDTESGPDPHFHRSIRHDTYWV